MNNKNPQSTPRTLHKSFAMFFTVFVVIFLLSGTLIQSQKAYAADPPTTPIKTTQELCDTAGGTYNEGGTCTLVATDCSALGIDYEPKAPPDQTEKIVCAPKATVTPDPESEKQLRGGIYMILAVEKWLNSAIWPVLTMIGGLMNNDILFGSGMDERLREIWIPIRNLVNLFFVLAMVAIAIYNILGIGEDNDAYSIKQILPKMIIAIIAVNFSFIGIKVFLDGINVLTSSIFALPDQVKEGLGDITSANNKDIVQRFCLDTMGQDLGVGNDPAILAKTDLDINTYKIIAEKFVDEGDIAALQKVQTKLEVDAFISPLSTIDQTNFKKAVDYAKAHRMCNNDATLTPIGEAFLKKYSSQNAALAMALSMSKIVFYKEIDPTTFTAANISKILVNTIFSAAMYFIFVLSFILLFVVLLARLVVMWLGIVASPLIIVALVVPVFKEKTPFGPLIYQFVKNAIAPIIIALAMTIGWIMLRAIQGVNGLSSNIPTITNGIPVMGLNTLQDLIVAVGTVAVLWLAVSAASKGTIAEPVTNAIVGLVTKAGGFVSNVATKHVPLFPIQTPGGGKINATYEQLDQALTDLGGRGRSKKASELSEALGFIEKNAKRIEDIRNATLLSPSIRAMKAEHEAIARGESYAMGSLDKFKGTSVYKRDLKDSKDDDERKLYTLIEKATDGSNKEEQKKALKDLATLVDDRGDKMAEKAEKREKKAGKTPAAKPEEKTEEYTHITDDTKINGISIGADNVGTFKTATEKLVEAINKKGAKESTVKPLLDGFKGATVAELEAFIQKPNVIEALKKIFGGNEKLQKALKPAEPAKAKSTTSADRPAVAERTAQATVLPPGAPVPQNVAGVMPPQPITGAPQPPPNAPVAGTQPQPPQVAKADTGATNPTEPNKPTQPNQPENPIPPGEPKGLV